MKVAKYFHVIKQVLEEHGVKDSGIRILNMDESGVQLEHKPGKIGTRKGTKYLQSGNRETITVIAAVNAQGRSLPPILL